MEGSDKGREDEMKRRVGIGRDRKGWKRGRLRNAREEEER
jgi:hypothetical protein